MPMPFFFPFSSSPSSRKGRGGSVKYLLYADVLYLCVLVTSRHVSDTAERTAVILGAAAGGAALLAVVAVLIVVRRRSKRSKYETVGTYSKR